MPPSFVNKSSKVTEEKKAMPKKKQKKRPSLLSTMSELLFKRTRPRFAAAEHSDIIFISVKSQLTMELIDEDYPAEKEEAS